MKPTEGLANGSTTVAPKGTKEFVARQKIVGLQIFSTASLNSGDSWENLAGEKNRSL